MSPASTPAPLAPTHTPRRALITGGAGFIGCNLVRYLLQSDPQLHVVVLDALTYAGSLANLEGLAETYGPRYHFIHGDICDGPLVARALQEHRIDTVIHLAAESHVDRSIDSPDTFIQTNIVGTFNLLHQARAFWQGRKDVRFHHVSTDEVFGSLGPDGFFTESTPYDPSSPYSASKAGSDHLVRAWTRTYDFLATISNCSNNYGPYQFPEKLIPLIILNALEGKALPVYGKGENIRDWLFVSDHCSAIDRIVRYGQVGQTYNVGGNNEKKNLEVVQQICDLLQEKRPRAGGAPYRQLISFVADRPGHDLRYAIDASKIGAELGWEPQETFASGMAKTIQWYLSQAQWLEAIKKERYQGQRLGLA